MHEAEPAGDELLAVAGERTDRVQGGHATDAAMRTSTGALGTVTQPSAEAIRVSECPTVNAVTTRTTLRDAGPTPSRALPPRPPTRRGVRPAAA